MIKLTDEEYQSHCNDYDGVCLNCHEWSYGGCEPDARKYPCESCGKKAVYGAEEALMMGVLVFGDEEDE